MHACARICLHASHALGGFTRCMHCAHAVARMHAPRPRAARLQRFVDHAHLVGEAAVGAH
eukprot:6207162-Pleurochrysis_carterae.AAC.3